MISQFWHSNVIYCRSWTIVTSAIFTHIPQIIGVCHLRLYIYNSKGNSKVQCVHRVLKNAIRCHNMAQWTTLHPFTILRLCNSIRESWFSPAEFWFMVHLLINRGIYSNQHDSIRTEVGNNSQNTNYNENIDCWTISHHKIVRHGCLQSAPTHTYICTRWWLPASLWFPYEGPLRVISNEENIVLQYVQIALIPSILTDSN